MKKFNELQELFERMVEVTPAKPGYKLHLDFAAIYGGYRIDWINLETGGRPDFDTLTRKSKKEMVAYIRGYLYALNTNKF